MGRVTRLVNGADGTLYSAANIEESVKFPKTTSEFRAHPGHNGPSEILLWSSNGGCLREWRSLSYFVVDLIWLEGMIYVASSRGLVQVWKGETGEVMMESRAYAGELTSF